MSILQRFHEGGIFMYVILVLGVATLAVVIDRALALYLKMKTTPQDFRNQVLDFVRRGDLRGASAFANGFSGTALGRIAGLGLNLRVSHGGEEEIQSRMDEQLAKEIHLIDRRVGFLATFGNIATLLGLLGTISGMIQSFAAVANANPADRATLLSKGISEAMNCTAFGLIVAIPALLAYALFQNKIDHLVTELTSKTTEIYHDLLFLTGRGENDARATKKDNGYVGSMVPTPA